MRTLNKYIDNRFLYNRFKTTEWCKACIVALALPDRTFNCTVCLSSLVNATPRYLNFSTSFNDTPPTCREHWTGFLEKCSTSVLEVQIFIPGMSHAAAKLFNACWKPDARKSVKIKSSAKRNRLIWHFPIVTHLTLRLSLPLGSFKL